MTLEEALKIIDSYGARERGTHDKVYSTYQRLRERLMDSTARITREMVRLEYGGNSTGTVSKYMTPIEVVERAKKTANSNTTASAETTPPKSVPDTLQKKLEAARVALDAIASAIVETSASRDAERASTYQRMLDEQKAAFVAELSDAQARIGELETDSFDAGREVEATLWQVEELRIALETSQTERDAACRDATELGARNELISIRLTAAEAQIATHQRAEEHYSQELDRLLAEREPLRRDADRGREAKAELERLRRRLDDVERRKRELTDELQTAHEREAAQQQRLAVLEDQLTRLLEVAVPVGGK